MRPACFQRLLVLVQILFSFSCFALPNDAVIPNSIIVKYKSANHSGKNGNFLRQEQQLEVVRHTDSIARSSGSRWQRLKKKIEEIENTDGVLYAEPNYAGSFDGESTLATNNPASTTQWWLPAVSDQAILKLGRGAGVVVAVIDTGVDLFHPDLQGNILADGYNIGDNNGFPQDTIGHGTMMAGIIAASGNIRNSGIRSLAPEAKILPIKINSGSEDLFTSANLANAIDYAVNHRAKIINLSLTVSNQTQTVRDAIQDALNRGVIVVASAGNRNGAVEFPANMPGVIGVAAVDKANQLAYFSNYGPEISIAAPGVDIFTTMMGGGYGAGTGTSYSTPIVAAAFADLQSINMTLPADVFIEYLRLQAASMSGGSYSFGSLDAGASGNSLLPHIRSNKERFDRPDYIYINYDLPRTGAAVDIYVAVKTPFGEFSLLPDGSWHHVENGNYQPIAVNYGNENAANGILFGYGGLFSSISTLGLPGGDYVWRTALVSPANGQIIGGVTESTVHLD